MHKPVKTDVTKVTHMGDFTKDRQLSIQGSITLGDPRCPAYKGIVKEKQQLLEANRQSTDAGSSSKETDKSKQAEDDGKNNPTLTQDNEKQALSFAASSSADKDSGSGPRLDM
jgi:ubiquitin